MKRSCLSQKKNVKNVVVLYATNEGCATVVVGRVMKPDKLKEARKNYEKSCLSQKERQKCCCALCNQRRM